MSFNSPSYVSATTGRAQKTSGSFGNGSNILFLYSHSITASLTTPTLCVFVIIIGPSKNPDSSTQVVPVISPFPLRVYHPAKTGSYFFPLGKIAVTPVRTGPFPTINLPSHDIRD